MSDFSAAQPAPASGAFSVGGVIKRAFSTYFANFVSFSILALILYLPSLIFGYSAASIDFNAGVSVDTGAVPGYGPTEIAVMVLSAILTYVLVGALVYGTVQHLNGYKAGVGELISRGLSRVFPVLVIAILFSIAFGIGFTLLIIPGVFLAVVWSVAIPASVVERPGIFGAFSRSWQLTKGYRWRVLGTLLILLVIVVALSLAVGLFAGVFVLSLDSLIPVLIVNYVIQSFSGALMSVVIAVLYHDLRVAKEGVSTAQLAAVFD